MKRTRVSKRGSAVSARKSTWLPGTVERLESRFAMDGGGLASALPTPLLFGIQSTQSIIQQAPSSSAAATNAVGAITTPDPAGQVTENSNAATPNESVPPSYSPGWVLPPSMPGGPFNSPPWIGPEPEPTPEEVRVQHRLNYLQSILGQLVDWGDAIAAGEICANFPQGSFNAEEWAILREHILHATEYRTTTLVALRDGSSTNLPFTPGFYVDSAAFYGNDGTAVEVLIHEPMHDLDWLGVYHTWPFNNIDEIVGPHTSENMFSRFTDYLQRTRYEGRSLWTIIIDQARQQSGGANPDIPSAPALEP